MHVPYGPMPQQSNASQLFGFGRSNSSCAGVGVVGAGVTLPSPRPSVTPKSVERANFAIVTSHDYIVTEESRNLAFTCQGGAKYRPKDLLVIWVTPRGGSADASSARGRPTTAMLRQNSADHW
jgi:hypothetical protein